MNKYRFLCVLPVCILLSCGTPTDNPDNIPLSGKWSDEGKLMAITVGGTAADPDEIPGIERLRAKIKSSREFCGEPRFLTKEEFQEEMDESNPAKCQVNSVDISGNLVRATGSCNAKRLAGGFEGSGSFKGKANLRAEKVTYDMTIDAAITDPSTGEGEMVTMEARRTMTRLGDC